MKLIEAHEAWYTCCIPSLDLNSVKEILPLPFSWCSFHAESILYLNSTYLECWDESQEIQCLHNAGLRCFVVHQCIKVAIHLFEDVLGKHVNSVSITRQSLGPPGHPPSSGSPKCFMPGHFQLCRLLTCAMKKVMHVQHTRQCSASAYQFLISK